jgi:carboxylesterase
MPGAEPFSASNGPNGVLLLHGFTGNPQSMRPLAEAFANAGFSVELPLLPGHGTSPDDLATTRFGHWLEAAERAYQSLAARSDKVAVSGLSMGGTLALLLMIGHQEICGGILVNPLVEPPAGSFIEMLQGILDSGSDRIPGIGSDIAKPGVTESAYDATPIAPALSLFEATEDLAGRLGELNAPILLFSSRQDHVVATSSGDLLVERSSGPIERVFLERSYHVATLDFDQAEVEERSVSFALKAVAS